MIEPDEERNFETDRWLHYAYDDLVAAKVLTRDPDVAPRQACWLAQQAAEKTLKAALCFIQVEFSKIHNLDLLRNLLPEDWSVKGRYPDLAELTAWAVEARYPGDWPDAMPQDSHRAVETVSGLLEVVLEDLRQHGFREEQPPHDA